MCQRSAVYVSASYLWLGIDLTSSSFISLFCQWLKAHFVLPAEQWLLVPLLRQQEKLACLALDKCELACGQKLLSHPVYATSLFVMQLRKWEIDNRDSRISMIEAQEVLAKGILHQEFVDR